MGNFVLFFSLFVLREKSLISTVTGYAFIDCYYSLWSLYCAHVIPAGTKGKESGLQSMRMGHLSRWNMSYYESLVTECRNELIWMLHRTESQERKKANAVNDLDCY